MQTAAVIVAPPHAPSLYTSLALADGLGQSVAPAPGSPGEPRHIGDVLPEVLARYGLSGARSLDRKMRRLP